MKTKSKFNISPLSDDFLQSYEWRKLRFMAIKLHGRKCQCCGATPETGAVINVDHIKSRKKYPELALDINNLQVLCHECNHGKGNWDSTDFRTNFVIDIDIINFVEKKTPKKVSNKSGKKRWNSLADGKRPLGAYTQEECVRGAINRARKARKAIHDLINENMDDAIRKYGNKFVMAQFVRDYLPLKNAKSAVKHYGKFIKEIYKIHLLR